MRSLRFSVLLIILSAALLSSPAARAQLSQQGPKLVGTGAVGGAQQGFSVALSADGNTAIVGGFSDNGFGGAAWVYTRSGSVWTQQGAKLVGTDAAGSAEQGFSVALSGDGNTAIVGGVEDGGSAGAAWVFTRSGSVWTQQGAKLVGTDFVGGSNQGVSVALSADGNTAIVGGSSDNGFAGAAWVYTRTGGVWTQQGAKLVGTGAAGGARQGASVALSADGNTAMVGGYFDNGGAGATWVFTRSGGVWTQQGAKLVGMGAVEPSYQGSSVALSADGNTAIVDGNADNSGVGAAWIFTRSGGVWTQQGAKLVGTGAVGNAAQGISVTLSADGNTALVGGFNDNSGVGAAWIFTRSGGVWTQQGAKLVGTGAVGNAAQGISVTLSADGNTALVGGFNDNSGVGAAWVFYIANYEGLWWAAPAASESGWGINFAHQDDTIFATWFTYDTTGKEWWLSMTANKTGSVPDTYTGQLIQSRGPAFSAVPFDPSKVTRSVVGTGKLTFTDVNNGSFAYSVTTAELTKVLTEQVKPLTRQVFGPLPGCSFSQQANPLATTNYTDLWWASPAGSEAGWGINLTQQGNIIFATWFTYDVDGTPLWLSATLQIGAGQMFSGALIKTAGPAFNAAPFDPTKVTRSVVGNASLTFSDGNTARFDYTVNTVAQSKAITRQQFNPPAGTVCQ